MFMVLEDGRGLHAPVGRDAELDLDIRSNERRIRASWENGRVQRGERDSGWCPLRLRSKADISGCADARKN